MKKILVATLFLSFFILDISSVKAATTAYTTLSGDISLRAVYDSNENRSADNEEDQWDTYGRASLTLAHVRQGKNWGFSTDYTHSFTYNFRTGEASWRADDFHINFDTWRNFSERLRFNFSDTFVKSNDLWGDYLDSSSTRPPEPEDEIGGDPTGESPSSEVSTLPDRLGRQPFWSNSLSTGIDYKYTANGSINLGYFNRIREYETSGLNNYRYDGASIGISQRFTRELSGSLSYRYTDAKFDTSEDFTTHNAGVNLGYRLSVRDSFSAGVDYYEKNYDIIDPSVDDVRNDYYTVSGTLGWIHNFSPHKTLSMSVGQTYVHRTDEDNDTSPNFDIRYTSQFETGAWFIGADGGYTDRSFEGFDEGLSKYERAYTGVGWQLAKDLSASIGASVRNDSYQEDPSRTDETTYNANAGFNYSFYRYFYLSGRYVYTQVDSDTGENDYVDHRFLISVGASKELYRWIH